MRARYREPDPLVHHSKRLGRGKDELFGNQITSNNIGKFALHAPEMQEPESQDQFLFNSNLHPEPLFKRLYSLEISRALSLVIFPG
jgi:hypothetical protein